MITVSGSAASVSDGLPKVIFAGGGSLSNGNAVANYILGVPGQVAALALANGNAYGGVFYFDPADYAIAGKTTQVSVAGLIFRLSGTETAAMALALRAVSSISSGGNPTLGSAIASASLVSVGAAAGSWPGRSSWVTAPAAGLYCLTFELATAVNTGGSNAQARLDLRWV